MGPDHLLSVLWATAGLHGVEWLWLTLLMPAGLLFGFGLRSLVAMRAMAAGPAAVARTQGGPASPGHRPGCAGCPVGSCTRSTAEGCEEHAQGA
ncbi:MAG: hypothetical protein ACYCTI_09480 [Acidimicrobiales bacterium]